jgi:hypothetical protein
VGSHRVLPLSGPYSWLLPLGFLIASNLADGLTVAPAQLLVVEGVQPQWQRHWNTVRLRITHWNTARRRRKFINRFPAEVPVPHVARIHKYAKRVWARSSTGDRTRTRRHVPRKSCNWCWDEDTSKQFTGRYYIDGEGPCRRHQ